MSTFKINKGVVDNLESSLSGKSSTDLDNLSQTGEAHFANSALSNSPYTTNRVLEIPQDIKLELNNGTLTLKAGSKVYFPNGFESDGTTPKFDVVTTTEDIIQTNVSTTTRLMFLKNSTAFGTSLPATNCFSGNTSPTHTGYAYWYDTANNIIRYDENTGTWDAGGYSLPVGIRTADNSVVTSINQVFNGFGYIGSTVFVLPGIKCEVPNGRDVNGACLNSIYTRTSVITQTYTGSITSFDILANAGFILASGANLVTYDSEKNLNTNNYFKLGEAYWNSGKCTGFKLKSVDSVVNSNASNFSQAGRSYLSGIGMPSSKYEDWTLGASDSTYVAPANGYVALNKGVVSGQYVQLSCLDGNGNVYYASLIYASYMGGKVILPVRKNGIVRVSYDATNPTIYFRFIYAEGEN